MERQTLITRNRLARFTHTSAGNPAALRANVVLQAFGPGVIVVVPAVTPAGIAVVVPAVTPAGIAVVVPAFTPDGVAVVVQAFRPAVSLKYNSGHAEP
jgi:hypothetical protein